ncbi:MAG: hypothetical protein IJX98_05995 [Clostridia bacterium]|nr:hypothetical protein [Clostridia bacterium]
MKKERWLAVVFAAVACGCCACGKTDEKWKIYTPDGAPALALAYAMSEEDENAEYRVVDAATIGAFVSGAAPVADACVLPVNLAAKLLGNGDVYQTVGVVTHGNLYLLATEDTQYTRENLSSLVGKTVGVVQLANVPGLTVKIVLNELEIPWQQLTDGAEIASDKVNLKAITPAEVLPNTEGVDVFVAPSPAADMKAENTALDFVGSLQALYGGEDGYPQAVLVVKRSVLESDRAFVDGLLEKIEAGSAWLKSAEKSAIAGAVAKNLADGLTPTLTAQNLTDGAIEHSSVRLVRAQAAKAGVKAFLEKMKRVAADAAIPKEEFFAAV